MVLAIVLTWITNRNKKDAITSYIYSVTLWTLYCYIITESLSFGNLLTSTGLLAAWGIYDICLLLVLVYRIRREKLSVQQIRSDLWGVLHSKGAICFLIYAAVMVVCALIIIPYNWDSMTYHCARLFHWAQNKSVAHYATGIHGRFPVRCLQLLLM